MVATDNGPEGNYGGRGGHGAVGGKWQVGGPSAFCYVLDEGTPFYTASLWAVLGRA